jgi:hypothetical protein
MSTSVTKLFGLEGDNWMRHTNPMSDPEYAGWEH